MGGKAFSDTLSTPRMPPEIYQQVRTATHDLLRKHFSHVATPIEAPGKETYGDIDVLAFGPLNPSFDRTITPALEVHQSLVKLFAATKWMSTQNLMFAIRWPGEAETGDAKHIQLDLHLCETEKKWQWELFQAAHGDLWNILGSTIRQFGLTVNNRGMFLRIPEIEKYDRNKAMIFLTDEPARVLDFIGLSPERFFQKFRSQDEMFEYAAGCRMFWVKPVAAEKETDGAVEAAGDIEGLEGGEAGKQKLKHSDKKRMKTRDTFRIWIDEFIPKCRQEGRSVDAKITRDSIREESFIAFGVKNEYESRRKEFLLQKHKDDLWRLVIKENIPLEDVDPAFRAASSRHLKLVIMEGLEFDGGIPKAAEKNEEGYWDVDEVAEFVKMNWRRAGQVGLLRQQAKAREGMKAKAEKKALAEKSKRN